MNVQQFSTNFSANGCFYLLDDMLTIEKYIQYCESNKVIQVKNVLFKPMVI